MRGLRHVCALLLLTTLARGDLLGDDDARVVSKRDLLAGDSDIFADNSSSSFSQLLFDVARDQVIVGARDALYRLSLRGLRQLERSAWPAPPDKAQLCQDKGQTEEDCHNYVKVLLSYGHRVYACGTNAFSPLCSWREIESIGTVSEWVPGVAQCPHSRHANATALLASTGEYYAGTTTDFAGSDAAICRSRGGALQDAGTLRTTQYDVYWLNEPQFVASFEDDTFVYFVFTEVAVEHISVGKIIYSRIARVCKNDTGGHVMMRDNWSTFLKARLTCSARGDVPFDHDQVKGVAYLPRERLLLAAFTTPSNAIAGSAVCVYSMADVTAAFEGAYRVPRDAGAAWLRRTPSAAARAHFRCQPDHRPSEQMEYHRYYLMYDPVQPVSGEPLYRATLQRFTHISVDVVATKSGSQLVAYVATENSDILKLAVLPDLGGACLVEILKLKDQNGGFDILNMEFVKDTMSLYIGSTGGVLRVRGDRCTSPRAPCAPPFDPHCETETEDCPSRSPHTCEEPNAPVDGGWSSWSEWEPCLQDGAQGYEQPDMCQCRTRRCDAPRPRRGGRPCAGAQIAVRACTVHGGWSPWSPWSECSATCGIAVKSRRRTCTAPEPRHGGRLCVGIDTQDLFCTNLPPCADPALAPVDGGWGPWSSWGPCTSSASTCGPSAGVHERRRTCSNPAPKNGGADCDGARVERQPCDLRPCEVKKATAWTPWVQVSGNYSDDAYTEKRFKFLCKAPSSEQIKLSIAREEERYCTSHGCSGAPGSDSDEGWAPWGPWGECSAPCGGGQQTRSRRCRRPPCSGSKDLIRPCNTHACQGAWSCWGEWGACVGACGAGARAAAGERYRTRTCLSPAGCPAGAAREAQPCVRSCLDASGAETRGEWGEWGAWAACAGGERLRKRTCARGVCAQQIQLAREGGADDMDNEVYERPDPSSELQSASLLAAGGGVGVGGVVGAAIAAFLMGCATVAAAAAARRRRRRRARVPSSPHYMSNQNSYVTVPLKDVPRKAKRQPSFTGVGGSGILLSKSNNLSNANNHTSAVTPKLYPKAIANEYDSMGTLRRHSNQPSHKNNLDMEEDKFY